MKKLLFALVVMCWQSLAFGQETRKVENFVSLYAGGNVKVELIESSTQKIEYTVIKGNESDLITDVSGGQLKIKIKQPMMGGSNAKAEVKVYYTKLEEIEAAAGATVSGKTPIKSRNLEVSCSSGARVNIKVDSDLLKMVGSSGSSTTLSGTVKEKLDVTSSSGAKIDASSLESKKVDATASSGSNIKVWAVESLDADASSGGKVGYKGDPKNKNFNTGMSGGNVSRI